ncbi:ABC transporter ATP-binding protein [Gordonia westfalica]|uniref:ABC transporter ATP-binding protein n=1 Tax=Gordonia westfalica TaxID=158898 RepID=A0ABU2GZH2_9ACTN|nr:ABC transporter ATP-binding protein [Gordonia westfalica]MDS1116826.1 ABC transporter ATP-binding protein [Gordonia westfalica]
MTETAPTVTVSAEVGLIARSMTCARGKQAILNDVDIDVPGGTRLAIIGPNGAGKSTLLRTLSGLEAPSSGTVRVGGADLYRLPSRRRAMTIAVVGQEDHPSAELTVAEAVGLGRTPYRAAWSSGGGDDAAIIADSMAAVELSGWENRSCVQLSGGERHRVMLARALAQRTPLLVLDEPTNHLDVSWRLRLMGLLDELDCTVIAAMHDLDLVLRHFDSVAVIADGGVIAHGRPLDVLTPALLRSVFHVEGTVAAHPVSGLPHLLLTEPRQSPTEEETP